MIKRGQILFLCSLIRDCILKGHKISKERYNSIYNNISYCVGEIVYFKRTPKCIGWTTKLQP